MWKSLKQKVTSLFEASEESTEAAFDPSQAINYMLIEMDKSIEENQKVIKSLIENRDTLSLKMEEYEQKIIAIDYDISSKITVDEVKAKDFVLKKRSYEDSYTEYSKMYQSVILTIRQVEKQMEKVLLEKEQTKAKEAILTAQISNAKNRLELTKVLENLESDSALDILESELQQVQIEANLTHDTLELDDKIEEIENEEAYQDFRKEVAAKQEAQQKKLSEQQQKRMSHFFEKTTNKRNSKSYLKDHIVAKEQSETSETDKVVNDFFTNEPEVSKEKEKKPSTEIDDFFGQGEKSNLIDDFFNKDKTDD